MKRAIRQICSISMAAVMIVSFAAFSQDTAQQDQEQKSGQDTPMAFETYYMVFLKRGPRAAEIAEEALPEIQKKHLAHLTRMAEEGYSLIAGPFEVGPEDELRGIVLYRGDLDMETVRQLAEQDPAVQAGRLRVEVLKWWTPAGVLKWANREDGM